MFVWTDTEHFNMNSTASKCRFKAKLFVPPCFAVRDLTSITVDVLHLINYYWSEHLRTEMVQRLTMLAKFFQEHTREVNFAAPKVRFLTSADEVQAEGKQECNHLNEPSRTLKNARWWRSSKLPGTNCPLCTFAFSAIIVNILRFYYLYWKYLHLSTCFFSL